MSKTTDCKFDKYLLLHSQQYFYSFLCGGAEHADFNLCPLTFA